MKSTRWHRVIRILPLLACVATRGAGAQQPPEAQPRTGIAVWDTGQPSAQTLSPAAVREKTAWTLVPSDRAEVAFKGDAVVTNGRILAVVRKQGSSVELFSVGSIGPIEQARMTLQAAGGDAASRLERLALLENGKGSACLEVAYKTAKGATCAAKYRLKRQDVSVETEPGPGAARMRIECPARFVVLPDFFADDIVIDARKIPSSPAEVPSENFLLHLGGKGDRLVACVFENRQQDARITLAGQGEKRSITGSEIEFGKDRQKIWVAALAGPGMWHGLEIKAGEAGKILPLDWKMPFVAQWRVDFTRTEDLVDSWEMLLQKEKGGEFVKPSWFGSENWRLPPDRKRWTTVLGSFLYPCWSDPDGQGFLQPLDLPSLRFRGPAVIYPVNREKDTPVEAFTVVDLLRSSLGVGPCEYILDLEGQKQQFKGNNTCAVRDLFQEIYSKNQQKQRRAEIEKELDRALIFVRHVRERIDRYVEFGHKTRDHLGAQKKAHPEWGKFLSEMDRMIQEIDARVSARKDKVRTPEHVAALNEDFRRNVLDCEGPDALERCRKYTRALVEVGDNQDELVGECRWVVKAVRQRAGLSMAIDPKIAAAAEEIRVMTAQILRQPSALERPRH